MRNTPKHTKTIQVGVQSAPGAFIEHGREKNTSPLRWFLRVL
mgnify:FL=1